MKNHIVFGVAHDSIASRMSAIVTGCVSSLKYARPFLVINELSVYSRHPSVAD